MAVWSGAVVTRPWVLAVAVSLALVQCTAEVSGPGGRDADQEGGIRMEDTERRALEAASEYLRTQEGADPSEYELWFDGVGADGLLVVHADHKDDLEPDVAPGAGSGKSLELRIDPETFTVESALGAQ